MKATPRKPNKITCHPGLAFEGQRGSTAGWAAPPLWAHPLRWLRSLQIVTKGLFFLRMACLCLRAFGFRFSCLIQGILGTWHLQWYYLGASYFLLCLCNSNKQNLISLAVLELYSPRSTYWFLLPTGPGLVSLARTGRMSGWWHTTF